ncbi:(2Fe-2S) ferredoxin domain-containing protein [Metabacillus litoralis]|jgi:(2Fe-2S) ferredoxin|uniref:(2Fe-2S) ferredoxin domain-containing protein n=1 Tax=Metabacillus litoralis TaxID=152268 RepID=UPI00203EA658|nr:(2Fe-2S) ferredoxin domain-containing protein [Metabacillus litoralis]MCM3654161.1 (2Fe-2S) ferredoxin domain-containing protein [Metabacillus litoralis]
MATWDLSSTKHHVLLCNGSSCNRAGAEELTQAIRKEISDREVDDTIHTTRTRCNGRCHDKCVVISYPQGTWYKDLKPEDASLFVDSLLADEVYSEKMSHSFQEDGFERADGVVTGVRKDKERVNKVSKII